MAASIWFQAHLFKIRFFCDYADQIGQLEKALARKPEKLQLDIIGSGELSPDTALLMTRMAYRWARA